jgi:hypothetical protein
MYLEKLCSSRAASSFERWKESFASLEECWEMLGYGCMFRKIGCEAFI